MVTYKGVCKLTKKEETIWLDVISTTSLSDSNNVIIGLMNDCSACNRLGIDICKDCNLYKDLPH